MKAVIINLLNPIIKVQRNKENKVQRNKKNKVQRNNKKKSKVQYLTFVTKGRL